MNVPHRGLIRIVKNLDCVVIYSMRGVETTYTMLDRDTRSPFDDSRPNLVPGVPEQRKYKYVYFLNDEEVGLPLELSVVVMM
ncbi:MAG: hypothetical protein HY960_06475 [Ignavibacteriae bacterium]|nr:hypothetical protein [Ignavibacteriota bacterium]